MLRCDICGTSSEEFSICAFGGKCYSGHSNCIREEYRNYVMRRNQMIQKINQTTWKCSCGALNKNGMATCMTCGKVRPKSGVVQKPTVKSVVKPAPKAQKPVVKPTAKKSVVIKPAQKTITIKCVDCGAKRDIHIQDAFQVKRCVSCQKAHRYQMIKLRKQKAKKTQNKIVTKKK